MSDENNNKNKSRWIGVWDWWPADIAACVIFYAVMVGFAGFDPVGTLIFSFVCLFGLRYARGIVVALMSGAMGTSFTKSGGKFTLPF